MDSFLQDSVYYDGRSFMRCDKGEISSLQGDAFRLTATAMPRDMVMVCQMQDEI